MLYIVFHPGIWLHFSFCREMGLSINTMEESMQPNMNTILSTCIGGTFGLMMNIFHQVSLMSVLWPWVQLGKLRNFWFCFHLMVWENNFLLSFLRKQSELVVFFPQHLPEGRVSYQKPHTCIWTHIPILAGKQRYAIFLSNKILDYRSNDSLRGVFRCAEIKDLKQMNLIIFVNIHNHIMCFKCHIWK